MVVLFCKSLPDLGLSCCAYLGTTDGTAMSSVVGTSLTSGDHMSELHLFIRRVWF